MIQYISYLQTSRKPPHESVRRKVLFIILTE
jgi:hypothetical protein